MTLTSNFFDVVLFLLSGLVTGPSFMSISSLVLKLWKFSFIRDWPEIRKSETPPSEFSPISGDWRKLWMPDLARMSLIECYWMLFQLQCYSFYRFWVIKGKATRGVKWLAPPPPPLRLAVRVWLQWSTDKYSTVASQGKWTNHCNEAHLWGETNEITRSSIIKLYNKSCESNMTRFLN